MENEEKRGERDGGNIGGGNKRGQESREDDERERERKEALTVQNFLCGVLFGSDPNETLEK